MIFKKVFSRKFSVTLATFLLKFWYRIIFKKVKYVVTYLFVLYLQSISYIFCLQGFLFYFIPWNCTIIYLPSWHLIFMWQLYQLICLHIAVHISSYRVYVILAFIRLQTFLRLHLLSLCKYLTGFARFKFTIQNPILWDAIYVQTKYIYLYVFSMRETRYFN